MSGHVGGSAGAAPVILHNEPVRVYDTSGPWGDPDFHVDVTQGLPPLRVRWIRDRGEVESIAGRAVTPVDDGWLSQKHADHAARRNGSSKSQNPSSRETSNLKSQTSNFAAHKSLRARAGCAVTQLAYARRGIITPEMEFIAIRENGGSGCQPDCGWQAASLPNQMTSAINIPAKVSARAFRAKSRQSLFGAEVAAVARSSPRISIIRKPSR